MQMSRSSSNVDVLLVARHAVGFKIHICRDGVDACAPETVGMHRK